MKARWVVGALFGVGIPVAAACTGHPNACLPADVERCSCADGGAGFQQCVVTGAGFTACDCSGAYPMSTVSAGNGLPGQFGSMCNGDGYCSTGHCANFEAHGPHCTYVCKTAFDCPQNIRCNKKGYCRAF